MSERLERLRREIEVERKAALADLGLAFDSPILICGAASVQEVIAQRLEQVPSMLRADAEAAMQRHAVRLPWLTRRRVAAS